MSEQPEHPPRQLSLPECSQNKTRRRSGKPLRRTNPNPSLAIPNMPPDVVEILKLMAKRNKMNYSAYCREVLKAHAWSKRRR